MLWMKRCIVIGLYCRQRRVLCLVPDDRGFAVAFYRLFTSIHRWRMIMQDLRASCDVRILLAPLLLVSLAIASPHKRRSAESTYMGSFIVVRFDMICTVVSTRALRDIAIGNNQPTVKIVFRSERLSASLEGADK